jgi:hypothetical protein
MQARHHEGLDAGPPHVTSSQKKTETHVIQNRQDCNYEEYQGARTGSGEGCHFSGGEVHYP